MGSTRQFVIVLCVLCALCGVFVPEDNKKAQETMGKIKELMGKYKQEHKISDYLKI